MTSCMQPASLKPVAVRRLVLLAAAVLFAGGPAEGAEGKKPLPEGKPKAASVTPAKPAVTSKVVVQEVTSEQLRQAVRTYLERRLKGKAEEVEVQILNVDEPVTVAPGILEVRVKGRGLLENFGRRLFDVALLVDGREVRALRVLAEITVLADVVTVTRTVQPQETLEAEDLTIARLPLPGESHDFLTEAEQAVGKRVTRPIRAETPVRMSSLAIPEVVHKGEDVTIEFKHGGLLIQASGTSKMSGHVGQPVTVLNQDSKREVRGIVVGPGVVRVEF
ncbi:MAG: flagellar basal body P-ring formation protein FlgA [Nitrospirae bacterium]|nr:MAG: flagellar basal body P-ring formation protein FlgA [Nitrospirota bacterium]